MNQERLVQLEAEQKMITSKNNNPALAAYNKLKSILAEKENEKGHFKKRIQKLNNQAINGKKEIAQKEIELENRRK